MQAAGIRPVGMAHGGVVRYGYAGNNGSFVTPNGPAGLEGLPEADTLSPAQKDRLAQESIARMRFNLENVKTGTTPENMLQPSELTDVRLAKKEKAPYDPYQSDVVTYNRPDDPMTWTSDYKREVIRQKVNEGREQQRTIEEQLRSPSLSQDDRAGLEVKLVKAKNLTNPDFVSSIVEKSIENKAFEKNSPTIPYSQKPLYSGDYNPDTMGRTKDTGRDYGQEREVVASGIRATEEAAARERAMPDKRDYGQEREGLASISRATEDAAARERAMPDKRDYGQEREANKGIAALGNEARIGTAPGAAAEAARPTMGVPGAAVANNIAGAGGTGAGAGGTGAGGTGAGDGGVAKSNEPAKYAPSTTLESIKADRAREREDNFNLALINAGLAMMGGKSSNALTNIGEGGMQGIKQFTEGQRETNRGYREDVKGLREEKRFADEMAQRERMQKESLGATSDLAKATRDFTASEAALNRQQRESEFGRTEDRLILADNRAYGNSKFAQDLADKKYILDKQVADHSITRADADATMKQYQFDSAQAWDKEKTNIVTNATPEQIKVYTVLGDGDPKAGYSRIADAAARKDAVTAAREIVRDMTGSVTEGEKKEAFDMILKIIREGASSSGNTPPPGFKYSGSTKAP
jgi:hypothetical protein